MLFNCTGLLCYPRHPNRFNGHFCLCGVITTMPLHSSLHSASLGFNKICNLVPDFRTRPAEYNGFLQMILIGAKFKLCIGRKPKLLPKNGRQAFGVLFFGVGAVF